MQILEINNRTVRTSDDIYYIEGVQTPEKISIDIFYHDKVSTVDNVTNGVIVSNIIEGYPAHDAGIKTGMIFGWIKFAYNETAVNRSINNMSDFYDTLAMTTAGDWATIGMYNSSLEIVIFNVTFADKYDYYKTYHPDQNSEDFHGKGFLGVGSSYLGLSLMDTNTILQTMAHPYKNVNTFGEFFYSTIFYISLPIPWIGLSPLPTYITDLHEVSGFLSFIPEDTFWVLANTFYWIFWVNLMLGLTNALPAVPLDGGYIFKDGLTGAIRKIKKDMKPETVDRIVMYTSRTLAIMVLFLILAPMIVPHLFG
jgi:membrane-associated protease RseP (regulator of RpoE activity)